MKLFYVKDETLVGSKVAKLSTFQFGQRIHMSPAMYDLWLDQERPLVVKSLKVRLENGEIRSLERLVKHGS